MFSSTTSSFVLVSALLLLGDYATVQSYIMFNRPCAAFDGGQISMEVRLETTYKKAKKEKKPKKDDEEPQEQIPQQDSPGQQEDSQGQEPAIAVAAIETTPIAGVEAQSTTNEQGPVDQTVDEASTNNEPADTVDEASTNNDPADTVADSSSSSSADDADDEEAVARDIMELEYELRYNAPTDNAGRVLMAERKFNCVGMQNGQIVYEEEVEAESESKTNMMEIKEDFEMDFDPQTRPDISVVCTAVDSEDEFCASELVDTYGYFSNQASTLNTFDPLASQTFACTTSIAALAANTGAVTFFAAAGVWAAVATLLATLAVGSW